MRIDSKKIKRQILLNLPMVIFAYAGSLIALAYRTADGRNLTEKLSLFMKNFVDVFASFSFSDSLTDWLFGIAVAIVMKLLMYFKAKNRKKFRQGEEYGSARFGEPKDIEPYMDLSDPYNNVILTQTEGLTMGRPSSPKYARNKNVEVIGGSGSGKSRFYVKPNMMQMHSSYVITDPKGTLLIECGKLLQRGRPKKDDKGKPVMKNGRQVYEPYEIKVFNTVDFAKSMHYNPFAYISEKNREKDILKFVEVLIKNTTGDSKSGEDFWVKAEKLLYTAYIALIFTIYPKEQQNFETLIDLINDSECREDDENFKNLVDEIFDMLSCWLDGNLPDRTPLENDNDGIVGTDENENNDGIEDKDESENNDGSTSGDSFPPIQDSAFFDMMYLDEPDEQTRRIASFALKQYKSYKLAAGKTAKSILISCSTRLAPFAIDEVLEITKYDELQLDQLGDRLTALFVIISDTDTTFNFLVAIMYSQMFNLLCTKADNSKGGRLTYHVRCLLDEFANIGEIPNFDKLIATIRSREISASIILQAKSQLKAIYKDNADTIEGNCDTLLFLGGKEKTTLKEISESLGKETIDMFNTSQNRGQSESYGMNYQKLGKELKSQDELAVMDGGKCILQVRGVRPFFSDKYDITRHSYYGYLLDSDENNYFDIEKYVKRYSSRRATVTNDTATMQFIAENKVENGQKYEEE